MTEIQLENLNRFFVQTFNKILLCEEKALNNAGVKRLSVKELHILEAVYMLSKASKNTMGNVAKLIQISIGALTTAVNALVRKGYLTRTGCENDRRIVFINLTDAGLNANQKHELFHSQMVEHVAAELDEKSLENLCDSLNTLADFFDKAANNQEKNLWQ